MAKKIKIQVDFTENNKLICVSCHKKDYWFAYHLNEVMRIKLRRLKDFPFFQSRLNELLAYSIFHDFSPDDQLGFYLISNFNKQSPLFPELKTTDFFLLIQGRPTEAKLTDVLSQIRSISGVLTAFMPDAQRIKDYDNLLADLELHMSSLKKGD